jgi:probable HAF family extracellular repeat protein
LGINNLGQVVGVRGNRAYRTAANKPINMATDDLGTLGGRDSVANAINDSGQVVGFSHKTADGMTFHAFRTAANKAINPATDDLGTLGGARSKAYDINKSGQVVGESYLTDGTTTHAFFYSGTGAMQDLNHLIDPAGGWTLIAARGINDSGQIVGYGVNPAGQTRAFLLTPVPEPSTIALLLTACVAGLVWWRRRS